MLCPCKSCRSTCKFTSSKHAQHFQQTCPALSLDVPSVYTCLGKCIFDIFAPTIHGIGHGREAPAVRVADTQHSANWAHELPLLSHSPVLQWSIASQRLLTGLDCSVGWLLWDRVTVKGRFGGEGPDLLQITATAVHIMLAAYIRLS